MAIAGKVAITPKGNWSASTAYTKLDLVFYNNGSYVAIQPSTGVTPTNTAYWMLALQSENNADIQSIINGETKVGDADKLDGHNSSYFAKDSDLAIERERITNLATLTEGSTTGDAELIDTRVGEDGVTYDSAGEAVRTQFANVKSDLSKVNEEIDNVMIPQNLFDASTLKLGGYYHNGGVVAPESTSYYSEQYIEVESNVEYTFTQSLWTSLVSCYYDSEKQFVSRNNNHSKTGKVTFPEGVKYIRVSFYQSDGAGFKFAKSEDFYSVTDKYEKFIDGDKVTTNKIFVSASSNAYYITLANGYVVNLAKAKDVSLRADLWNILGVEKNGVAIVPYGTDIIGVLQEKGQSDFMGGVHGDETNVNFLILADGKAVTGNCYCEQLDVLMYSHLTRVSTGENIIDRYVHIVMRENYIEVDTTFKCLVDNFNLAVAYNGGMMGWYDNMADFAMTNIGIIDTDGVTTAKTILKGAGLYHTTAVLGDSVITCENIIGHDNENYLGEAYYYGNEATPRMKIYFGTDKNSIWENGHICKGKARYTFN